jgi:hypothetical protein
MDCRVIRVIGGIGLGRVMSVTRVIRVNIAYLGNRDFRNIRFIG